MNAQMLYLRRTSLLAVATALLAAPSLLSGQLLTSTNATVEPEAEALDVTFARDVAPILQENCETCHRPGGVAPMSFVSYEEVRPWAPVIAHRTGLRDRAGAMPPYYLERGIGIQHMQDDERLEEEEIETIAAWVEAGAPLGDPADLPAPKVWDDSGNWRLGMPDLIVRTEPFFMEAGAPDWWGDMPSIPVGLEEDRYAWAVEIREVNSVEAESTGDTSVGGRWIVHHMIWSTRMPEEESEEGAEEAEVAEAEEEGDDALPQSVGWPVHELGRNPDIFDPRAGRLLRAGSEVVSNSVHLHSSGADTEAYLEIGFFLHPPDYEPEYRRASGGVGDGMNIDIRGGQDEMQELHSFTVLDQHTKITSFEPHLHGPGARMCLQAIWGMQIETLNCSGYDHNWVKQYTYDDDYAPLLPKGTVLHLVGYMDMSETSPNVPDPRNWQGSGNRSITNMFIDLGNRVALTDEQFVAEMAQRRDRLGVGVNDHVIGCPLCGANIPTFDMQPDADTADTDDADSDGP
jgi:mono/diheme cytochrome c family protein